jgi:hypothetical protein
VHPRLEEEWRDIVATYPDAVHKPTPERVELTLTLDPLRYRRATTAIAVLIPPAYRATGPDGFLVPAGLAMTSGETLPVSDAAGLGMPGWLLVSFHLIDANGQSTWRPSADSAKGDNIIGYVASIESFLARGCK